MPPPNPMSPRLTLAPRPLITVRRSLHPGPAPPSQLPAPPWISNSITPPTPTFQTPAHPALSQGVPPRVAHDAPENPVQPSPNRSLFSPSTNAPPATSPMLHEPEVGSGIVLNPADPPTPFGHISWNFLHRGPSKSSAAENLISTVKGKDDFYACRPWSFFCFGCEC